MFAVAAPNVVARPSARKAAAPKRGALVIRMQGKGGEEGGKTFGNDIIGLVSKNANFAILASAITKAGLAGALSGPGPFTVFAPDDDAFNAACKKLGVTKLALMDLPTLGDVLKAHVISGKVLSSDLKEGQVVETLGGKKVTITLAGGPKVNGIKIKKADVNCANGVIHAITEVIL